MSIIDKMFLFVPSEKLEDTQGVITSRILQNDRQYNDLKKKDQNDIQNTTQKPKDWLTRTPLKSRMNSGAPKGWIIPTPLVAPVVLNLLFYDFLTFVVYIFVMLNSLRWDNVVCFVDIVVYMGCNTICQRLCLLSGLLCYRAAANKEATELRVPSGYVLW